MPNRQFQVGVWKKWVLLLCDLLDLAVQEISNKVIAWSNLCFRKQKNTEMWK